MTTALAPQRTPAAGAAQITTAIQKQQQVQQTHKAKRDTSVHLIAGAVGGATGTIITCPLEVVRTRLQASHNKELFTQRSSGFLRGTFRSVHAIYETEGFRGLWRGLGPALTGVIPSRASQFATYAFMKRTLAPVMGENTSLHLISASVASMASTTFVAPIWLIKTRLQLQTNEMKRLGLAYNGSWDCVRRVYREEGVRGFYKGLTASYLGMVGLAVQFSLYEKGKEFFMARRDKQMTSVEYLGIASAAKGVASVITYPHEVLRTRFREQRGNDCRYTGIMQAFRLIAKEEGVAGLYGGLGPHLLKVIPNAAIMFLTYECMIDLLAPLASSK